MTTETINNVLYYVWRAGDELPKCRPIGMKENNGIGPAGWQKYCERVIWPKLPNDRAQHQRMIDEAYTHACEKHPKLCDIFTDRGVATVKDNLENCKGILELTIKYDKAEACRVLHEECLEVEEAYLEGRPTDCLYELAQCGAVVKRMMEYVQEQIDKEGEKV